MNASWCGAVLYAMVILALFAVLIIGLVKNFQNLVIIGGCGLMVVVILTALTAVYMRCCRNG